MVRALHHRGPDDCGTVAFPDVAVGMARLAILDLSPAGHQPMANQEQSIWIVYNGETYNFDTLRGDLERKGHHFRSRTDTEVVLRMYEVYGDDFLLHLRGMFSLAIVDRRHSPARVLLARDPLGIKPLVYYRNGATLVFASELKALLASGRVPRVVDPDSLRLLLTYGAVVQPRTILQGASMLPAGHRLVFQGGHCKISEYWRMQLGRYPELARKPYREQVEFVADALSESLALHAVSDAPLGAFLSGGVDSSLTTALLVRQGRSNLRTFSIGFGEEGLGIDESRDAQLTADYLGTNHQRVQITGEFVRDNLSHIAWALDQPSVDGLNSYLISWAASQTVKVAISGTGGDELFAGYPFFITMLAAEPERGFLGLRVALSRFLRLGMFNRVATSRFGYSLEAQRARHGFLPRYARTQQLFGVMSSRYLAEDLQRQVRAGQELSLDIGHQDELAQAGTVERVSALCLRGYTQNQLLRDIDCATMAHSLEVRVPFLDTKLVDISLSLPSITKLDVFASRTFDEFSTYRLSGAKKILVDAAEPMLRPGLADQPKRGFAMPFDAWLRGPLREILEDTLSPNSLRRRGLWNVSNVEAMKNHYLQGGGYWNRPWLFMMTELWCREVLDRQ